ncbi:hypothetical protein EZS27_022944 [termite gut metagenome]|uniref:Outer membrane protein beta-barrel domain-containing protein n=1 Tax=termite gut metagenome TaxID=433724 RepID=A0A5J4R4F6_9ZZZZ
MKKTIISTLLCVGFIFPTIAQEKVNVDKYLPQAGDIALGIDAAPIGRLINLFGEDNGSATFRGVNNQIYLKYFLENDRAVRVKLGLNFTQNKYKENVINESEIIVHPTNTEAIVIDTRNEFINHVNLNTGYEFRRGKGRIQGFYGGEVLLGYASKANSYDYANPITSTIPEPKSADFNDSNLSPAQGHRVLKNAKGATFNVGLGGFVGAEYFLLPQLSIGGEFGLNFNYAITGQNEITTEGSVGGYVQKYQYRGRSQNDNAFNVGISTLSTGTIFLLLHF